MFKYYVYKVLYLLRFMSKRKYQQKLKKYFFKKSEDYLLVAKSAFFDAQWYLMQYPDVASANMDPCEHYLKYGWKEGRNPSSLFDGNAYLRVYSDVRKVQVCPLLHYEQQGKKEDRSGFILRLPDWSQVSPFVPTNPSLWDKFICKYKNKNPKISIIVASYNYQDYIKETLDSLIAQTYKNFEVIVVDDGSSDHSVEIIKEYTHKYDFIKLYQHSNGENRGLVETLKLGLSKSVGEYVSFCESDDYWTPNHLEEHVNIISKFAVTNIIANDVCVFGDYNRSFKMERDVLSKIRARLRTTKNQFSYEDFRCQNFIPTFSCCTIKKSSLLKCQFEGNPRPSAQDWWLYRQLIAAGNSIFYIPEQLTFWRMHQSYNSHQKDDYKSKQDDFNEKSDAICHYNKSEHNRKKQMVDAIRNSTLFDAQWYQKTYAIKDADLAAHYLFIGWKKGYNPSPLFDGNLYLSFYDDVYQAEMNPLWHYEQYGKKKKRWAVAVDYSPIDVFIVTAVRKTDGVYIWRVNFLRELFEKNGFTVADESLQCLGPDFLNKLYHAKLVIFNRPAKDGISSKILAELLKLKKHFIIDIDDLIISDFAVYSGRYKSGFILYANVYNSSLLQSLNYYFAPLLSVSTPLIAEEMSHKFQVPTVILPNRISEKYVNLKRRDITKGFKVLYASGTETHGYDASTIYIDLFNFMLRYPNVTLTILGASRLHQSFEMFKDRLTILPYVNFEQMLEIYARHDLLLVPLDKNPFNNAKSNIKYIEAGAVGTPILAKDCNEFKSVIRDGINGFIYQDNFYDKLEEIYHNRENLYSVGKNAYQDVVKNHTTNSALPDIIKEWLC